MLKSTTLQFHVYKLLIQMQPKFKFGMERFWTITFKYKFWLLTFSFSHYKVDKASMLDEAIEYLKTLQLQVQVYPLRETISCYLTSHFLVLELKL